MNEFELISSLKPLLTSNAETIVGAGDDCAVIDLGLTQHDLLFKTDAVVQGVHFLSDTEAERVGHKALARCLSDVAAMGGSPHSAVVTLGLPEDFDPEFVLGVYRGINRLAQKYDVAIVGGETTRCLGSPFISVALVGKVQKRRAILRSKANVGDALFVTGDLGASITGKHLDFTPRVEQGLWLATSFDLSSMIDVSDGLAGDLAHLLQGKRLGAELASQFIPISRAARRQEKSSHSSKPALLAALTDGEDFELLFTIASTQASSLKVRWRERFPDLKLTCIGKIVAEPGVRLRDSNGVRQLSPHGFSHFA